MTARVILSSPGRGAWNMALDEAIQQCVGEGVSPLTLRLYAWQPACLSIGYAQPLADVDQARLQALGWDLVRRPTGGKAILHADELTYAITGPAKHPLFAGGILPSYRRLSQPLAKFLLGMELPVVTAEHNPNSTDNPICFQIPAAYEITVHGKKVIGSAQHRKARAVLQHGSIPLTGDLTRICQALSFDHEEHRQQHAHTLKEHAATLEDLRRRMLSWDQAAEHLLKAFSSELGLEFQPSEPSELELEKASKLESARYANPSWSERQ